MTTSRFALLAVFSLSAALPRIPALAQVPPMHGQQNPRMRAAADAMNFTDAQKAQLRTILMGASQQAQAVRANTSLSPAARTAKMQAIQQRVRAQMMAVLTPAQRARAKSMAQNHRQGHPM